MAVKRDEKKLLENELQIIAKWEDDQNKIWFWEKIFRLPFTLLDKITPHQVHQYVGKFLDEVGSYIQYGGKYLIHEAHILQQLTQKAKLPPHEPLLLSEVKHLSIQIMNEVAEDLITTRKGVATLQGATTGVGGLFSLAIDIPMILGLSLKVLQEMALTYGYNPNEKKERVFIVKCLQFSSADIVGKKSILKDLSHYHKKDVDRETLSQIEGWREVMGSYRDHYGWKKLFQLVPILGIILGALINRSIIEEVAETGHMLYRKRRVLEKLEALYHPPSK